MSKMKELYEKVASDSALQAKFSEIMKKAEEKGSDATAESLVAFAKEEGYEVGSEEITKFFAELSEKSKGGELSDMELDSVAGGKGEKVVISVAFFATGMCFDQ